MLLVRKPLSVPNRALCVLDHVYCRKCWLPLSLNISTNTCKLAEYRSTLRQYIDWVTVEYRSSASWVSVNMSAGMCIGWCSFSLIDPRLIPYWYFTNSLPIPNLYSVDIRWLLVHTHDQLSLLNLPSKENKLLIQSLCFWHSQIQFDTCEMGHLNQMRLELVFDSVHTCELRRLNQAPDLHVSK